MRGGAGASGGVRVVINGWLHTRGSEDGGRVIQAGVDGCYDRGNVEKRTSNDMAPLYGRNICRDISCILRGCSEFRVTGIV
jgi:hypothetical protein